MNASISIPSNHLPLVLVIGAGFAGIELIRNLPADKYRILLIDRNNYHTFQPLLYQVAIGGLEPDSVAYPIRKIFSGRENFYFRIAEVHSADLVAKKIETSMGSVHFDYLVLATGSKANFFGLDDLKKNSLPLKTVTDALDLRSLILQNLETALQTIDKEERGALLTMVVVGGGPTGIETAGALAELKKHVFAKDYPELDISQMKVCLVESGPELLSAMSPKSRKASQRYLKELGVVVILNAGVKNFDGTTISMSNGQDLKARTVIWSAGVAGNVLPDFPSAAIEKGRIRTDAFNRVTGYEGVFALGDVAAVYSESNPKGFPMLAPVAKQQGRHLAKNFARLQQGQEMVPFSYFDKGTMATVGRARAVLDLRKLHLHGFIAWIGWLFIHLMYLVGYRNKIIVLVNWSWNYIRYDSAIRLIIRPFRKIV